MNIEFTKMHGLGNDFVVIDNMNGRISFSKEQIVFLCNRHEGIGADGLILVEATEAADCFMNYYNADGSIGEMCGNGVRCVAKFLKDYILKSNNNFKIDTRAGVKDIEYAGGDIFSVNMGKPVFSHLDFPPEPIPLEGLHLNFVSMGNPHAVAFVRNFDDYELSIIGPLIEDNSNFPNKINLQLVQEKNKNEYKVKTWERGCGITLACGTGACAVYALSRKLKGANESMIVELPGGALFMSENKDGEIIMRGEAKSVYTGMVYVK